MRRLLVTVSALLGLACTADERGAPVATPPTPTPAATPPTPTPATPPPTPATPPATPPAVAPLALAPPTLQAGPDRYQLPASVRGSCEGGGGGPFCGAYIVELADGKITTLLTRDGAAWFVRAGKLETPTVVEFVDVPSAPGRVERVHQTFNDPPGTHLEFSPPIPLLARPLDLPAMIGLSYALVILGDKLYGTSGVPEPRLTEIDPRTGEHRVIDLSGRTVHEVHPAGDRLALYLGKGRETAVASFDPATGTLVADFALPRDLEPECRRSKNSLSEQSVVPLPNQGRIYIEFMCYPDD